MQIFNCLEDCEFKQKSSELAVYMLDGLKKSGFDKLVYYNNRGPNGDALPSPYLPQVDLSVIELSNDDRIISACNILYDRDHPDGYLVDLDRKTITSNHQISFSVWRESRWLNQELWIKPPAAEDIITNPKNAKFNYMLPYPASCLKTITAFIFMTLVDEGKLTLDSVITYQEEGCVSPPEGNPTSNTLRVWLEQLITVSYNFANVVLLQYLYLNNELERSQNKLNKIGLNALKFGPAANPACGRNWYDGYFAMGSLDTSKLLLIIFGAPGKLWSISCGKFIYADEVLSKKSQHFLQGLLFNEAYAEVLNPVGLCTSPYKIQGFKTNVPSQFIGPNNTLVVPVIDDNFDLDFGYDMTTCLAAANTKFAHKTGLTEFSGCDHGYVTTIDGDNKKFIITLHTSAGSKFGDPDLASAKPSACDQFGVCYSNAFPFIANYINKLLLNKCNYKCGCGSRNVHNYNSKQ